MEFNYKFETEKDYENFVQLLKDNSKNETVEYYNKHKAIINTKKDIIAIKMQVIRDISKKIAKNDLFGFLKLAKDDTYEEVLIQGLVITYIKDIDLQIEQLKTWMPKMDCWAHVDGVVGNMKIYAKSPKKEKYFDYFYNLCFEKEEFISRFGIVVLMSYFIDDEHIDKIIDMCKNVKNTAFYIEMALAWLVSVCFVKQREKTLNLLREQCLDKFTQNKSISKCRDSFRVSEEDKEYLKTLRIK